MKTMTKLFGLVVCVVSLSTMGMQTSMAQSISFSGTPPKRLVKTSVVDVKVNHYAGVAGIVQVQLVDPDANWKAVAKKSIDVSAGIRSTTLRIPIMASLASKDRYIWQAVLYTRSWGKLDESFEYNIKVEDAEASSKLLFPRPPMILQGGTTVDVKVAAISTLDGILAITLYDSRWHKVVGRSVTMNRGSKAEIFRVPIPRNIAGGDRYIWQAQLATRNRRIVDEKAVYNVTVRIGAVPTRVPVTIRRHSNASLTNAEADRILEDSARMLQTNNGSGDVACAVAPVRSGNVRVYTEGDGSINSDPEYWEAINVPGTVKVVESIDQCAGVFNPSIFGCANGIGGSFVIERSDYFIEGRLWLHELGHTRGLPHRNTSPNNIMNGNPQGDHVNQTECNAYSGVGRSMWTYATHRPFASNFGPIPSVEKFVSRHYFDGLPIAKTVNYSSPDATRLALMLKDENYIQYHENIALTLGMIGDSDAVTQLIAYAEDGVNHDAKTAKAEYKGRVGSIVGLGYLVNRIGSDEALNYLLQKRRPVSWYRVAMQTKGENASKVSQVARQLRNYTIMSLGLSGNNVAKQQLRKMKAWTTTVVRQDASKRSLDDIVGQSLDILDQVANDGLIGYYQRGH